MPSFLYKWIFWNKPKVEKVCSADSEDGDIQFFRDRFGYSDYA